MRNALRDPLRWVSTAAVVITIPLVFLMWRFGSMGDEWSAEADERSGAGTLEAALAASYLAQHNYDLALIAGYSSFVMLLFLALTSLFRLLYPFNPNASAESPWVEPRNGRAFDRSVSAVLAVCAVGGLLLTAITTFGLHER